MRFSLPFFACTHAYIHVAFRDCEAEEQEVLKDFGRINGGLLLIQRLSELSTIIGKCYSTEREKVLAEHNIHHSDYATKLNLEEVDNFYSDFYYKISSTTDDIEVAELTLELEAGTPIDTPHTSVIKPIYALPCLKMAS